MVASLLSNGIWFAQFSIVWTLVQRFTEMLRGGEGISIAVFTGLFYVAFSMTGSIVAHYWALKNEKGKAAVGANRKYAQITTEEWAHFRNVVERTAATRR
jgi:hypothetical protein